MQTQIISDAGVSPLPEIAFALLWAGDDRRADAIFAAIEARERAHAYAGMGNVVPLFPADLR